jgi:glucose/arabinose dehydrogenase
MHLALPGVKQEGKSYVLHEGFMSGFVLYKETVWGAARGIAVAQDGALLVSDAANGRIFRIAPANR